MLRVSRSAGWERAQVVLASIVVGVVVVGALYWAQSVLMPVALAIFVTFLLSPVVTTLRRWKLGRVPSVILATLFALILVLAVGWLAVSQMTSLVSELPNYSGVVKNKFEWVRSTWQRVEDALRDLNSNAAPPPVAPVHADDGSPAATIARTPVVVDQADPLWARVLSWVFRPTMETLGQAGLTAALVVFMLLKREDLRYRIISLIGHGSMTLTTKAVDDASQRISRFLLMQLCVNAAYGTALAIGLALIGVKYALLWGFLVGIMRYLPYIGGPLMSLFPITLSLVQFDGWWPAVLVIGLVVLLEVVVANFVEPRVYGHSIGVSEVALVISAAFWAFLWGPVGMVLSCPLTVCLVVLGKYVPYLNFFAVLLGDEPALSEDIAYYQRLAARDEDEAEQIVAAAAETRPVEELYDALLLPSLQYATRDRLRDLLDEDDERFIYQVTHEILDDLEEKQLAVDKQRADTADAPQPTPAQAQADEFPEVSKAVRIMGLPARDKADEVALEMLRQVLDPAKWDLQIASFHELTSELIDATEEQQPALICIVSLPPGGLAHTRYLCKRLRTRFPDMQIVVGRWGQPHDVEENLTPILAAGADHVETTLLGTRNYLRGWRPPLLEREAVTSAAAGP